jgi:regulator of sigma E protease
VEQRGTRVIISEVGAGSAGAKAGLRVGDALLSVDGETVFSAAQARGMLRDPPNTNAAVRVSREGRTLSLRFKRSAL